MDLLAREKAKLEVMMCSSLVLFPNSIIILPYPPVKSGEQVPELHPLATHRVTLDIQYADTTFTVLVTMEHPLDFVVTSPLLLPMKYLDKKPLAFPPHYPNTSLVELVRWIISQMKNYMGDRILAEEKLSGLASAIDNLTNMNIITEESYELVVVGNKATLLVKFKPEKDIKLASTSEMLKEDKLLNTGGHFFVLKMMFRVDTGAFLPGKFSVAFSSDLAGMLPELTNFSHPGLTAELATDLVGFLMYVKDIVDKAIMAAVAGWEKRAKLLLQLLSIFEGGDVAVPYIDSDTMSVMQLAFRGETRKSLLKIELSSDYPAFVPKLTWVYTMTQAEGARETRDSGVIKERELSDKDTQLKPDMNESEIVKRVIEIMSLHGGVKRLM